MVLFSWLEVDYSNANTSSYLFKFINTNRDSLASESNVNDVSNLAFFFKEKVCKNFEFSR